MAVSIPTTLLYFESHVTLDPIKDHEMDLFDQAAFRFGFRRAKLLMDKGVPSQIDTFATSRDTNYQSIERRTIEVVHHLNFLGFKVRRYKIENTLIDSNAEDKLNLFQDESE